MFNKPKNVRICMEENQIDIVCPADYSEQHIRTSITAAVTNWLRSNEKGQKAWLDNNKEFTWQILAKTYTEIPQQDTLIGMFVFGNTNSHISETINVDKNEIIGDIRHKPYISKHKEEIAEDYEKDMCPYCRYSKTHTVSTDEEKEQRHCNKCNNDYIIIFNSEDNEVIESITDTNEEPIEYEWKDIVCINGKYHAASAPISGHTRWSTNGDQQYQINEFIETVAQHFNCEPKDIDTYMLHPDKHRENKDKWPPFHFETGLYINGIPERQIIAQNKP